MTMTISHTAHLASCLRIFSSLSVPCSSCILVQPVPLARGTRGEAFVRPQGGQTPPTASMPTDLHPQRFQTLTTR